MELVKNNPMKFLKLNFNLKNWIFSFLDFEEMMTTLFYINSEFTFSLNKNKMIIFFRENYNYLLQQIHFSSDDLTEIKRELSESFKASEETYNQICAFILSKKFKTDKQLYLKRSQLPPKIIFNYVSKQKHLQILCLSENCLARNPLNIKYLCDIALKLNSSLQKLYLNENEIGKNPTDLKYLGEALSVNNSIKDLDLNWNEIGKNKLDLFYLCQALKSNKHLRNIYMYNNMIGNNKEDMMFMRDALRINKTIKELDLSWNCIGDNINDFDYLSKGLEKNKTLSIINLTKNPIDKLDKINILKDNSHALMIISFSSN